MKPLTIEQLKSLEVGDWVWISRLNNKRASGYVTDINFTAKMFTCRSVNRVPTTARIADYGKTWLAYKNKEQAECMGEIVELPCIRKVIADNMEKYHVYYIGRCGLYENAITYDWSDNYEQAKRHLAELKGEVNGGEEKYA